MLLDDFKLKLREIVESEDPEQIVSIVEELHHDYETVLEGNTEVDEYEDKYIELKKKYIKRFFEGHEEDEKEEEEDEEEKEVKKYDELFKED